MHVGYCVFTPDINFITNKHRAAPGHQSLSAMYAQVQR